MVKRKENKSTMVHRLGWSYWIGANLIEARNAAGMSQESLAEAAGLSVVTIQSIEAQDVADLTVGTLEALANALELELPEFFVRSRDSVNV